MFILETSTCTDVSVLAVILFIKNLIEIISYIVPVILVILLIIDIVKAIIANDEEQIKNAQHIALKRILYALIIFFIPIVVDASFGVLDRNDIGTSSKCYANATEEMIEKLSKEQNEKQKQKDKEMQKNIEQVKKLQEQEEKRLTKLMKEVTAKRKSNGDSTVTTGNTVAIGGKKSKTYKNIKILDTLTRKDFDKVSTITVPSSASIAQSFTVVGDYYVVASANYINTNSYVSVYNKRTTKKLNSINGKLGHSNGMTYNASDGYIYVTHGVLTRNKVHKFTASKIQSRSKLKDNPIKLSKDVSGIGYDDVTGKMYYAGGNKIYEYSNGKLKFIVKRKRFIFGQSQDICVHNGVIYDIRINGGNIIDRYRIDGAYLGSYKTNVGYEIESIDYYGEGNKMAILFHHSGSLKHYIYVIDLIMPK